MTPKGGARGVKALTRRVSALLVVACVAASATGVGFAPVAPPRRPSSIICLGCHSQRLHTGGLDLESLSAGAPGNSETWEKVIARLRAGSMPPPDGRTPTATYIAAAVASRTRSTGRGWSVRAWTHRRRPPAGDRIESQRHRDLRNRSAQPRREVAAAGRRDRQTAASITSRTYCRSRRRTGPLYFGGAAGDPARHGIAARRGTLERFEMPLYRGAGRSRERGICRSDHVVASPFRHNFPVDGEYLIRSPPAAAISGLPHGHGVAAAARRAGGRQADQALHGRRRAPGRPAPASYAGDGEPALRRRFWETSCRSAGDAGPGAPRSRQGGSARGRACRSSANCGSPKGCRNRCSAAALLPTIRCTWTTRTSAPCRSADRIRLRGPANGHAEPPRDLRSSSQPSSQQTSTRARPRSFRGSARLAYRRPD